MPTKLKIAGLRLQWHITYECDQRCRHCYVFDSPGHEPSALHNLDWKASKRILEDFVGTAQRWSTYPNLAITGGDPLLHPDFFRLLEYARKIGVSTILVMGNPFHLDRSTAKKLSRYINGYQISLDGMQQTHDHLRKRGSYAESLRALELLRDSGIKTSMAFTLSRINKPDLLEAMRLAVDLNITSFGFDLLTPTGRGKVLEQQLLSPPEVRETFDQVDAMEKKLAANGNSKVKWGRSCSLWKLWLYERNELDQKWLDYANTRKEFLGGCLIGEPCLTLQANGNVVPCPRIAVSLGKMPEQTISQILTTSAFLGKFRHSQNFKKCGTCPLVYVCRGCPAHAYSLTGDPFAPDPYCWRDTLKEEPVTTDQDPSRNFHPATSVQDSRTTYPGFTVCEKQALRNRDFWLRNLIERDEVPHICHVLFEELFPWSASILEYSSATDGKKEGSALDENQSPKRISTIQISGSTQEWTSQIPSTPYYVLINGRQGIPDLKNILGEIRLQAQKGLLTGIGLYLPVKHLTAEITSLLERHNLELMLEFDHRDNVLKRPTLRSFALEAPTQKLLKRIVCAYNGRLSANLNGVSSNYAAFISLFQQAGFLSVNFSEFQGLTHKLEFSRILTLLADQFDRRSFVDITPVTLAIRMLHFSRKQPVQSCPDLSFAPENLTAFYMDMAKRDPDYLQTICQTHRGLLQRSQELVSAINNPDPLFESG